MIHLVGVNHNVQRYKLPRNPTEVLRLLSSGQCEYKRTIETAIHELKPDLLAEEDSAESLSKGGLASILQAFHVEVGIEHLFVDPNCQEREVIGYKGVDKLCKLNEIGKHLKDNDENEFEVTRLAHAHEIAHQFPIRERFWLKKLKSAAASNILFVCGDIHISTFPYLLANEEIAFGVFEQGIGVNPTNNIEYEALKLAQDNQMSSNTGCFCLQ